LSVATFATIHGSDCGYFNPKRKRGPTIETRSASIEVAQLYIVFMAEGHIHRERQGAVNMAFGQDNALFY
jgi:hypothetical protein